MAELISIPLRPQPEDWQRLSTQLNSRLNAPTSNAIFVWDRGCETVPVSTTISGAHEIVFPSQFTGNGTLIVTVFDAEGGVHVALNGVDLGALTGTPATEVLYEVAVTNLTEGENALNSFKIWSTTSDSAELRKLEVYRNFVTGEISDASGTAVWGNITGTGKPEDDATVGADNSNLADDAVSTPKIVDDAVSITDHDLDVTLTPTSATYVTILTLTIPSGTSDNVEVVVSTKNAFFTFADANILFRVQRDEGTPVTVFERDWTITGDNGAGANTKAYIFMDSAPTGGGTITYTLDYKLVGTSDSLNDRVREIYFRARQMKK